MASMWDTFTAHVRNMLPSHQTLNSAGEALLHAPFDAVGAIGDMALKPFTDVPSQIRGLHDLITGHLQASAQEMANRNRSGPGPVSAAANAAHDYTHTDTAAPKTQNQKFIDSVLRGGVGGAAAEAVNENVPDGKWYKPAAMEAANLAGNLLPGAVGGHGGLSDEPITTTGTDVVPSKGPAPVGPDGAAPVGTFGSARDAGQHIVDNKLGGSHEIVAHGDGSYSAVPRAGNITTPAPEAPEAPQSAPDEAPVAAKPITTSDAPETAPVPQEAPAEPQRADQPPAPPLAPDGLPGNGSVRPIDPAMMARIMGDPGAVGLPAEHITTSEPVQQAAAAPMPTGQASDFTGVASEPQHITTAPVANPNFMEPTVSPSGRYTHEVTADTPTNQSIYSEYQPSPNADPIKTGLLIDKATGKTTVNVNTAKMGDAADVANTSGPTAMRGLLQEVLQAHPEISEISGVRKTGAGGKQEITQGLSAQQVARIRKLSAPKLSEPVMEGNGHPENLPGLSAPQLRERARQEVAGKVSYLPDRVKEAFEQGLNHGRSTKTPYETGVDDRFLEQLPVWAKANHLTTEQTAKYLANLPAHHPFVTHFMDLMNQRPITPRDPNAHLVDGTEEHLADKPVVESSVKAGKATPVKAANDTSRVNAVANFAKNLAADQRGSLGYEEPEDDPKATDHDPVVHKLIDKLTEGRPLRRETTKAISQERSERIAKATKAMYANEGEESLNAALGALKGEMPKAVGPSIAHEFPPEEQKHLFELIKASNRVSGYGKIDAMRALRKLLGPEYSEIPTEREMQLLGEVFPKSLVMALKDEPDFIESALGHGANILGIPRAIKTIGDLGVPFRQCSLLIGTKAYWAAFPTMIKSIGSEAYWQASMNEIKDRPTYPAMVDAKLALTDLGHDLTKREEFAASKIAEKIPGVRQSERGFTGALNKIRADTFDKLYNEIEARGGDVHSKEALEKLGDFVNTLSGRGSLGELGDKASPFLAAAFFSPRLQFSRVKLLTYPVNKNFWTLPKEMKLLYFKGVIASGLFMMAFYQVLEHAFGAKVNTNPIATDYGRAKIGSTRFDPTGSFQPYIRTVAQIVEGKKITAAGKTLVLGDKYGQTSRLDIATSFIESKFSPNAAILRNEFSGPDWRHPKAIGGDEQDWEAKGMSNPAVDALIPMGIEAMMKAGNKYGYDSPLPYAAGASETVGIGANTYDSPQHPTTRFPKFSKGFSSKFPEFSK